ncbi:uncharacterized protein LOC109609334 [Aethina tumida]|uniref:uncharacterized protein LOC109609334 n=1 Tax=Aethina tumida TaxID=116153 RepID=UPI0021493150|nr:uncharacterized protein LOC109609334 [Aethina tumida]XP_049818086.1 uncharacterized protein LOC109609334 [Aethina tumida]XP_049818087.1 uncharacterized protein LOC109609334 [Aethina tumida]
MIRHLLLMSGLGSSCTRDCSGRGECHNGTCMCEIRFTGELCDGPNLPYHAGIGGVFLFIGFVCAVQLVMCIICEYQRLKAPTFLRACKITNQKFIYFASFLASVIRGAYFISPDSFKYGWSAGLLSSYYPLLMSSASLIVCFWAEVFHLERIYWEKPQFLSKSFLGFLTFNVISYSLLLAEFITNSLAKPPADDPSLFKHLFNGCYAVLMFIVVIFFLIYGVEVYFKVRGRFVTQPFQLTRNSHEAEPLQNDNSNELRPQINLSQLHQSRIGLISQALMLITVVGFLFSETLSEFWKTKVPINSRNLHDVIFRVAEIGVAVWFPAVLWNCMQPSELWILNPRKLLTKLDHQMGADAALADVNKQSVENEEEVVLDKRECWICYDSDKTDQLIQPCACTGDVSSVHHDCLRRWLMESSSSTSGPLRCKVCNYEYDICSTTKVEWDRGFTYQHWGSTAFIVTCLCMVVAVAWIIIQLYDNNYIRMLSASVALLMIYICIKFLGQNTLSAYQRAKVAALNIGNHVTTISGNVNVDAGESPSSQTNL